MRAMATTDNIRRAVTLTSIPKPIPGRDDRASLHELLDLALDALAEHEKTPAEPQGPGRIADE